ncbi:hypothetical protein [Streptosporangium sp. NPDC051022]|uniref:hypothetical protein n=1 Tax=Streptosporangium sp. NPDC051022 TaxID=3155752 RepID=UPI00341268DE
MEYLVVVVAAMVLVLVVHASLETRVARRVLVVLLAAFAVRLVVHVLVLRGAMIGYGGDNLGYEARAIEVVGYWRHAGIQYVTSEQLGTVYGASLPCNVFALVIYLCGGPAPLACTAVIALLACALCVVMYRFARLVGADEDAAVRLLHITAFMPGFLLHTSDTFKDGFNALLVVGCLGLAASSARRFSVGKLLVLGVMLWALWYVRPYMVFMCAVPMIIGIVNPRRVFSVRGLLILAALLASVSTFAGGGEETAAGSIQEQLEQGQSGMVIRSNNDGGSGVVFDDGGNPWNALGSKLLYTLLSPFPWTGGSMALQLGKVDVLVWYYLLWSAVRGTRRLWATDRVMLGALVLFIVPSAVAYATTMANIGLIFRQRMPIVMITSLLAAVAWNRIPQESREPENSPPEGRPVPLSAVNE